MISCKEITAALNIFQRCADTDHGFRITTHCLYPSFEPVDVYIYGFGEGFRVHDLGGARREAWLHGVDDVQMSRILNSEALKHQVVIENGFVTAVAPSQDWLFAAVTAVANTSANAARNATEKMSIATEELLHDRIEDVLSVNFPPSIVRKNHHFRGKSGKDHVFDFALRGPKSDTILISAVSAHHFSISSKYVAFADTKIDGYHNVDRFAVFDRDLDASDTALLGQVSDLVPLRSLIHGARRLMVSRGWQVMHG